MASKITIDYYVEPYKKEHASSAEDFIWDVFSFIDGIIREYGNLQVNGTLNYTIDGSAMPVVPAVKTTAPVTFKIDGKTFNLAAGTTKLYGCVLTDKRYDITITGNATVSIIFTGGSL